MTASSTNWARTFFTFWTGQALSLFGTQLVQFALVWWLTETTGSATVLATPWVLAVDVLTALLAVGTLTVIAIPQPGRTSATKAPFWSEMRAGLRYTSSWPGLMAILVMATAINFFLTAALSLLPILVTKHFGGAAMHLASLSSAFGIGIIAGGMALGVWGGFRRRMQTSLTGLIGLGLGFLLLGLTPATMFWMALAATVLAAIMSSMSNGPLMAVLQTTVAPAMQGRVFTLMASMAMAISPLGLAVAGPVADRLGVQIWYIGGGGVCMGMGILAFFVPSILNMEDHRASPEAAESEVTVTSA